MLLPSPGKMGSTLTKHLFGQLQRYWSKRNYPYIWLWNLITVCILSFCWEASVWLTLQMDQKSHWQNLPEAILSIPLIYHCSWMWKYIQYGLKWGLRGLVIFSHFSFFYISFCLILSYSVGKGRRIWIIHEGLLLITRRKCQRRMEEVSVLGHMAMALNQFVEVA